MDLNRFDRIARSLGTGTSRRALLGGAIALGLAALPVGTEARRRWSERQVEQIITRAARRYDQSPSIMLRVARCESNLDPYAVNRAGPYYGLFQFLPSTWRSTPYGKKDWFDPRANALAAGWMWKQGRKNEWVCQ